MTEPILHDVHYFKGMKNDENSKQVPFDYFFRIKNWNYGKTGIAGLETILVPDQVNQIGTAAIDGLFEHRYLDTNSKLVTENISVTNGFIYKGALGTEAKIDSNQVQMTVGRVSFLTFNDLLYVASGKNHVKVCDLTNGLVGDMGAPLATVQTAVGFPNGTYYYAITYVTAGGEEVIGTVSNTVVPVNRKVSLALPLGYSSTTTRNIYRTAAGGSQLKKLVAVADNTTLTYLDNIADGDLTTNIPATGNEHPKPYFLTVAGQKIFGAVVDQYPTQVFITGTNLTVFDAASGLDVANYGNDNTPIAGIGVDFNKIVVGTKKNMILIDPSDNSVIFTRANVGIKNGYTAKSIPSYKNFAGGLMFVSTLNDIRVMSGLQSVPVATSVDNVNSVNWGQNIRGDLDRLLKVTTDMYAEFNDYRYSLALNGLKFVFDIRVPGWTSHEIVTDSYTSAPVVFGIFNDQLYNGQADGWIEKEYVNVQYRGEDVEALLESPHIGVSEYYKYIEKLRFWFVPSKTNTMSLSVITDDEQEFPISVDTFSVKGGVFNSTYYNKNYFAVDTIGMDYRVFNIQKSIRWFKYFLTKKTGSISLQSYGLVGQALSNKE